MRKLLGFFFICFLLLLGSAQAESGFSYEGVLLDDAGNPRHGYFDIKATLWSEPTLQAGDIRAGQAEYVNIFSDRFLGFAEDQKLETDNLGRFSIKIGRFAPLPRFAAPRQLYLQIDVKPSGSEYTNWETIDMNEETSAVDRVGFYSSQITHALSFLRNFGTYSAILLDNQARPLQGQYVARFSLWTSPDVDEDFDFLGDRTLNTVASNYMGYVSEVPFETDATGRFTIPLGEFTPIDPSVLAKDLFLQIEVKRADEDVSAYEVIDPDDDPSSTIDRFWADLVEGGLRIRPENDGVVSHMGADGKWLVNRIPGGTTSRFFELGVGNIDRYASMEIRANQGEDPQGILRYNGYTNRWEISNDGQTFQAINDMGALIGTENDTFTIGLNDDGVTPLGLVFGESLGASLFFDPDRNIFRLNRGLDFSQNQLINVVFQNLPSPPANPVPGQQYFNTEQKEMYFFDGTIWKPMGPVTNIFGGGGGTTVNNTTIVNEVVDQDGTDSTSFTLNQDADPDDVNVELIAEQGSSPNGILRYNATTDEWEVSSDGGATFTPVLSSGLTTRSEVFEPSMSDTAYDRDGTDNKGKLEVDRDDATRRNLYRWRTVQTDLQDIDIIVEWTVPPGFSGFGASPITLDYRTDTTAAADNFVSLSMVDSAGAAVTFNEPSTSLVSGAAGVWESDTLTFAGAPTFTVGDTITLRISLNAKDTGGAELGRVVLTYTGT